MHRLQQKDQQDWSLQSQDQFRIFPDFLSGFKINGDLFSHYYQHPGKLSSDPLAFLLDDGRQSVQYSMVQYSTVQYSTVQYSTVQYSTVQYSTLNYSTAQYSTVQYSKVSYPV